MEMFEASKFRRTARVHELKTGQIALMKHPGSDADALLICCEKEAKPFKDKSVTVCLYFDENGQLRIFPLELSHFSSNTCLLLGSDAKLLVGGKVGDIFDPNKLSYSAKDLLLDTDGSYWLCVGEEGWLNLSTKKLGKHAPDLIDHTAVWGHWGYGYVVNDSVQLLWINKH